MQPGLRPDLVIRRQSRGNEVYYIIKDPRAQLYYRYHPDEWEIIALFDGKKTTEQMIEDFNLAHPTAPIDEESVESYRQALKDMDLLALPSREKSLQFMERLREQRKVRAESGRFKNLFEMTFSAWDPDDAFNRVIPYLRFLWSKPFLIVTSLAIALMVFVSVVKWEEFKQGTIALYTFSDKSLWDILVFIFLMTSAGSLHELGHGLTLKYFGGEVRQMGFLLFYLTPAFYCDVSDAYLLTDRKQRLWVTFAGVYTELILCSISTFVWFFATPGTLIYDLAFKVILFTGISSFLINMNPLIKLDGYYALMDSLEVPELREESFEYLNRKLKRLFGLQVDELEGLTKRKRKIYVIYGTLAILYTLLLYFVLVSWLRNIFLRNFQGFGYVLLLGVVYLLFKSEIRGVLRFSRFFYLDKKEVFMKRKNLAYVSAGLALLALLAFLIPTHTKISSRCLVQPVEQAEVRVAEEGFVRKVLIHQNETVAPGQKLAHLENPELEQQNSDARSALTMIDRQLMILHASGDTTEYQMKLTEKSELTRKNEELTRRITLLDVQSPIHGKVITPYVEQKEGQFLARGAVLCKIEGVDRVKIEIPFREYYVESVGVGQKVALRLESYPSKTFEGDVQSISPAIRDRVEALEGTYTEFLATAVIDNSEGLLIPGMRGDAKILSVKRSIGGRIFYELRRWIQSRIW